MHVERTRYPGRVGGLAIVVACRVIDRGIKGRGSSRRCRRGKRRRMRAAPVQGGDGQAQTRGASGERRRRAGNALSLIGAARGALRSLGLAAGCFRGWFAAQAKGRSGSAKSARHFRCPDTLGRRRQRLEEQVLGRRGREIVVCSGEFIAVHAQHAPLPGMAGADLLEQETSGPVHVPERISTSRARRRAEGRRRAAKREARPPPATATLGWVRGRVVRLLLAGRVRHGSDLCAGVPWRAEFGVAAHLRHQARRHEGRLQRLGLLILGRRDGLCILLDRALCSRGQRPREAQRDPRPLAKVGERNVGGRIVGETRARRGLRQRPGQRMGLVRGARDGMCRRIRQRALAERAASLLGRDILIQRQPGAAAQVWRGRLTRKLRQLLLAGAAAQGRPAVAVALLQSALAQRRRPLRRRNRRRRGQRVAEGRRVGPRQLIFVVPVLEDIDALSRRGTLVENGQVASGGRDAVDAAALRDRASKVGLAKTHCRIAPLQRAHRNRREWFAVGLEKLGHAGFRGRPRDVEVYRVARGSLEVATRCGAQRNCVVDGARVFLAEDLSA